MMPASEIDLAQLLTREHHRIHLVGVAGSGMSGIAALLLELGHNVSGSDKVGSLEIDRLQRLGLHFHPEHRAEYSNDASLVVFSSAIKDSNPILVAARAEGRRLIRRAEALAAIMSGKRGIVIAGMHGKTTTSAMAAHVLREGGMHPSHYVGAEIPLLGSNAHWDPRGEYFVAEGDESDGTIRFFRPEHTLILNIEEEHLDFYQDLAAIESVFSQLIEQTSGAIFYCADDPNASRICRARANSGSVSFGIASEADYRASDVDLQDFTSRFQVHRREEMLGEVILNVPGRHNVSNSLGVVAVALELGIPFEKIVASLRRFEHARRRFEIKYKSDRFLLVDDYAHHPTEIRATLATARSTGRNRILTMFQPHRYSRTKALRREFGRAFDDADRVIVTDVYPASEVPLPGISGQTIVDEMIAHGHRGATYQPRLDRLHCDLGNMITAGDLVLSLGAGNIHEQLAILAADLVIVERLKKCVGEEGDVRLYEPLAKHTTLRVGGPAQFWVEPRSEAAFADLICYCRNLMATLAVGLARGLSFEQMLPPLCTYEPRPHRCEFVREVGGVIYVNDSKATNLDAVEKGLLAQDKPVILIAGGKDKGFTFETLSHLVSERVRAAILIGEMASRIEHDWNTVVPCQIAHSLADAVERARAIAKPGEVVLFSPGTSSFDMFKSYADRGDQFRALVHALPK